MKIIYYVDSKIEYLIHIFFLRLKTQAKIGLFKVLLKILSSTYC